jgi:3-dehydroquinate synthase II
MREIWVKADPWSRDLVVAAIEGGADAVVIGPGYDAEVKSLGVIKTVSEDGDIRWGRDIVCANIESGSDEEAVSALGRDKMVLVRTSDWRVIPLENLVARGASIIVEVVDREDARLAGGILERGVDGIIIANPDPAEVRAILLDLRGGGRSIRLESYEVRGIRPVGMGDRVCIDTCTLMGRGQGCLVGNSGGSLFLVHSESVEGPYAAPRPFRINAGGVHAYVMAPGNRTRYLSELRAGDEILGSDHMGQTSVLVVGRVKIEKRPLLLMEAESPEGIIATLICQNAETIRLVGEDGGALSVAGIRPGHRVLGLTQREGRHFGYHVQESIIEQ